MAAQARSLSLFDPSILGPAVGDAFKKLNPRTLWRNQSQAIAKRLDAANATKWQEVPAHQLKVGDIVVVEAGDLIPSDGEIIEGIASVDESAITGESAPVIRESGGDRSAVTG